MGALEKNCLLFVDGCREGLAGAAEDITMFANFMGNVISLQLLSKSSASFNF